MVEMYRKGERVFQQGHSEDVGEVLANFQKKDGTVWTVIETDAGKLVINRQGYFKKHRVLPPLVTSKA